MGRNALDGDASVYPPDNFFPRSVDQVEFMARDRGDYRLAKSSCLEGQARRVSGAS